MMTLFAWLCVVTLAVASPDCAGEHCLVKGSSLLQEKRDLGRVSLTEEHSTGKAADTCRFWCAGNQNPAKCKWRYCKGCAECNAVTTTTATATTAAAITPAPTSKYAAVGCMPKIQGMRIQGRSVPETEEGIEECLNKCKKQGHAFGGFNCKSGTGHMSGIKCLCWSGTPWETSWASPHYLRYTNRLTRCGSEAKACPGKVGDYYLGSEESVAVYGLHQADEFFTEEGYKPVAEIPLQPAVEQQDATVCTHSRGLPLSTANLGGGGGNDVVIPAGGAYYVDKSMEVGNLLVEEGAVLSFADDASLVLGANSIIVKGTMQLGTRSCPLTKGKGAALLAARIVLRGSKPHEPVEGDKGLVVKPGGTLDIHGYPYAPTWTRLTSSALPGSDTVVLQEPVNWEPGQEVVVVTTVHVDDKDDHQNEVRTIKTVDGSTVVFTEPLEFYHYGGSEYQAEVGLLSRSISIEGDDQSDDEHFGGHIQCHKTGTCRFSYARGYRLGQLNVMGRYPFHFHMMGDVAKQSYMEGLAVQDSYWRAFTLHGTSNSIISRSVAYNIMGSAVYLEDGIEEGNLIQYNLVAHVNIIAPLLHPWTDYQYKGPRNTQAIETVPERLVPTDLTAAAFYCTNPNNRWIGNAASGGFSGYIFPMLRNVVGLSFKDNQQYSPVQQDLLEFDGNTCHSSGQWWGNGACLYAGGNLRLVDNNASHYWYWYWKFGSAMEFRGAMTFNNSKFFASRTGLKMWGLVEGQRPAVSLINVEFHDNMLGFAFFGHNMLQNAVLTAHTANTHVFPVYTPTHGFQTYDNIFQTIFTDVVFRGYKGPSDYAIYNFVVSDCCTPNALLGMKGLSFPDTPWKKRIVLNPREDLARHFKRKPPQWANDQDVDGSLTNISGGAILGAADNNQCSAGDCESYQWWRMDDNCVKMFKDSDESRGFWACPKVSAKPWATQKRTVVSIVGTKDDRNVCGNPTMKNGVTYWWRSMICSRGAPLLEGHYYHFGHSDRRVYFGWNSLKSGKLVVGSCCDIGWYLDIAGETPQVLQLMLEQMVPTGGLVWATTYPQGAKITVQKCFGSSKGNSEVCEDLAQTPSKSDFLSSKTGNLIMIDSSNTVFLKLVNERNVWFGEHVLANQFVEQARYIIRSTVNGEVEMALPAENWMVA